MRVPFACLTNGGGTLERDRATLFNNIVFGQDERSKQPRINPDQMILCHTPIRDLKKEYEEKFVLVSGTGNILEIC